MLGTAVMNMGMGVDPARDVRGQVRIILACRDHGLSLGGVYPELAMTKRLIDVDADVLEAARRVLGTDTMKDTVNAALRASVQAAERRQHLDAAALKRFAAASR